MFVWRQIYPSEIALPRSANLRRNCMESTEHIGAYTSPKYAQTGWFLARGASFILFFPNILTKSIISQIWFFCYVTLLDLLRERTVRILCCKKVEILQITLQCDSRFSAHEKIEPIKADQCLHILRTLRKEGYTQSEIELIFNSIVLP